MSKSALRSVVAAVALCLALPALAGNTSDIHFVVVKEENGKPVRNASVVLHTVHKNGKQSSGGLELKTDADGTADYDAVPYGKLRIQVIAKGFQTYGDDVVIDQPKHEIVIKLKPPKEQLSIYK